MVEPVTLAIAGGAALLGVWWLMSDSSSGTVTVPKKKDGKTQGGLDGCAAGTADAKAGFPQALNPTGGSGVSDAADASTDPAAYLSSYQAQYDSCWTSTPKPSGGGGGGPAKTKPPPGATGPDRGKALDAYGLGCNAGVDAGYSDGYFGNPNAPKPSPAASASSGNSTAYGAAFREGYAEAYLAGSAVSGFAAYDPTIPLSSAGSAKAGAKGGCSGKFDGWYASWVSGGAKVGATAAAYRNGHGAIAVPRARVEVGYAGMQRMRAHGRTGYRGGPVTTIYAR